MPENINSFQDLIIVLKNFYKAQGYDKQTMDFMDKALATLDPNCDEDKTLLAQMIFYTFAKVKRDYNKN
jgi:hypothetical protein